MRFKTVSMRLAGGILSLALLTTACSAPPDTLPGPTPPRNRWHPPAELLEAARKVTYPTKDEEAKKPTWLTLRAGLRLPDGPAARACAIHCEDEGGLDAWEQARVVKLLRDHYHRYRLDPGDRLHQDAFDTFRRCAGSTDIPYFVNHLPEDLCRKDTIYLLSKTHYHLRSSHLPIFCKALFRYRSKHVREAIMGNILIIASYTDKHREVLARTLLRYAGVTLPADDTGRGKGIDPLLAKVYQVYFLDPRSRWIEKDDVRPLPTGEKPRKIKVPDFSRIPPLSESGDRVWEWANRWLVDSIPAKKDIHLIRKLVDSGHYYTGMSCCRILRHIPEAVDDELMAKLKDSLDPDHGILVHLEALRGDPAARRRLTDIRLHRDDKGELDCGWPEDLFLVAFELAPETTYHNLVRLIGEVKGTLKELDHDWWMEVDNLLFEVNTLEPASHDATVDQVRYRCRLPDWVWPRLYRNLRDRELPAATMLKLVQYAPEFRTVHFLRRLARHRSMKALQWRGWDTSGDDPVPVFLASLALLDPDGLRTLLWHWVGRGPIEHRRHSLLALLQVGDPKRVGELIALVQAWVKDESWGELLFHLGRSGGAAVEGYLERTLADLARRKHEKTVDALCGFAAAQGLHGGLFRFEGYRLIQGYFAMITGDSPVLGQVIALLQKRQPVAALVTWLENPEQEEGGPDLCGLGAIQDPRINRFLRDRYSEGAYPVTLGELVLQGDKEAIDEYWSLCLAGRYGWIDESASRYNTLGGRLCTLPFWVEECGGNCCRMHNAASTLEDTLGPYFHGELGSQYHTYGLVTEWMRRHGKRLRWSELLGHYIPMGE